VTLLAWAVCEIVVVVAQHESNRLRRRADLGAALRRPSALAPARVVRISEGAALHAAGLRPGDEVLSNSTGRRGQVVNCVNAARAKCRGQVVTPYRVPPGTALSFTQFTT
jgi:hypothetical protein